MAELQILNENNEYLLSIGMQMVKFQVLFLHFLTECLTFQSNSERNAVEEMQQAEDSGTFVYAAPVEDGDEEDDMADNDFADADDNLNPDSPKVRIFVFPHKIIVIRDIYFTHNMVAR